MNWHTYSIIPIDFYWDNLKTVKETICSLIKTNELCVDYNLDKFDINTSELNEFISNWESAKKSALTRRPVPFWHCANNLNRFSVALWRAGWAAPPLPLG